MRWLPMAQHSKQKRTKEQVFGAHISSAGNYCTKTVCFCSSYKQIPPQTISEFRRSPDTHPMVIQCPINVYVSPRRSLEKGSLLLRY